jgi:hypothetical protein
MIDVLIESVIETEMVEIELEMKQMNQMNQMNQMMNIVN